MLKEIKKEFISPFDEYTAIPFWFWNGDLKSSEIVRQINDFKDKEIMGFVIHPRLGIMKNIQYMSYEYLELVKVAVEEAERLGMIVFLYDEASYPSGSAHGMVIEGNPEYASRGLKMIEYRCSDEVEISIDSLKDIEGENAGKRYIDLVSVQAVKKKSEIEIEPESIRRLKIDRDKIKFVPPDNENWVILVFIDVPSKGTIRGIHFGEDDGEPEAPPSADILNPDAVKKFISLTHEKYYEKLKRHFGKTIKAIFTDEPGIMGRGHIPDLIPWTGGFLEYYIDSDCYEEDLPALWFEIGKETQNKRKQYYRVLNKRLENTYYKQISNWCEQHNIALTGHPEKSEDIGVLKQFQIPCQDIVWRWVAPEGNLSIEGPHSTMGKCSSDAARHAGRRRNGNECFGCCYKDNDTYHLPLEDIKWYLDWLFVRGVNLIIPHAFFYSVKGRRRLNERPPDVGPNNLYWPYYSILSRYIKRMCWLMTDSVNVTEIAVLCSYNHLPWKIVKPLFENQIEFNYLEDTLLVSDKCTIVENRINIEAQSYTTILVEDPSIIHGGLFNKLQNFINSKGNVIILDNLGNVDNVTFGALGEFKGLAGALVIENTDHLIRIIEAIIEKDLILANPNKDVRVSHIIKKDIHFYLLVNEGENLFEDRVKIKAKGSLQKWDAIEGTIHNIGIEKIERTCSKYIELDLRLERRESMVLCALSLEDTKTFNKVGIVVNIDNKYFQIDDSGTDTIVYEDTVENINTEAEEVEICFEKGWSICSPLSGKEHSIVLETWTKWDGMENYSGMVSYFNQFTVERINELTSAKINLGEVQEVAQLFINDREVGVKLWGPFIFAIKDFLKQGVNTLEIKVTNSLANKLNNAGLISGLIGPCRILLMYF